MARLSPSRHTLHCRLRFLDRRAGRPSPLRTTFCCTALAICHSQRLPTQRRRRSDPNATSQTRSRPCDDASSSLSPRPSRDALVATPRSPRHYEFPITDAVRLIAGEAISALMPWSNQSAARLLSIRESRLQADAPDNRAYAAPRRPRTTGRTTRPGNTLQSLDLAEAPPAVVPTAPAVYSKRRANGPAGTRPRNAHRGLSPSRLSADPATRCGRPAPTRHGRGSRLP